MPFPLCFRLAKTPENRAIKKHRNEPPKHIEHETIDRPPVGNLTDFVEGIKSDKDFLDIEVAVKHDGRIAIFHTLPFKKAISWFEFDMNDNRLDFIFEDGDIRDIGLPLKQDVAKHMQNSHQILTVLINPKTREEVVGPYVPLILHRS